MARFPVSSRSILSGITALALLGACAASALAGPVTIQSVSVSPNNLAAGAAATGTVKLNSPAPAGGQKVGIACGPQLSGDRTVTVPEGANSATFAVTAGNPPSQTNTFVRVQIGQSGMVANVTVRAAAGSYSLDSIQVRPSNLRGGESASLAIRLTGPAPSSGVNVQLSSSDPRALPVPSSVRLVSGARSATVTVRGGSLDSDTTVTITATCQEITKTCTASVAAKKR